MARQGGLFEHIHHQNTHDHYTRRIHVCSGFQISLIYIPVSYTVSTDLSAEQVIL